MFSKYLADLFGEGKVTFAGRTLPQDHPTDRDVAELARAYVSFALSVAGPPIPFDARATCDAAELVRWACWALMDRAAGPKDLKEGLRMGSTPSSPGQHLSADLTLRYLPQVLRRAQLLDPTDPLVDRITDVLLHWPLSGALADLEGPPVGAIDFGGHPGLLLLYAERVAARDRPGWRPVPPCPAYEYHQLVVEWRSSTPVSGLSP